MTRGINEKNKTKLLYSHHTPPPPPPPPIKTSLGDYEKMEDIMICVMDVQILVLRFSTIIFLYSPNDKMLYLLSNQNN